MNDMSQKPEQKLTAADVLVECLIEWGELEPVDFAKVAEGFGVRGLRIDKPEDCGRLLDEALAHDGPVLVDAIVDGNEPMLPPKRMPKYIENMKKALPETPGHEEIARDAGGAGADVAARMSR